MMMNFSLFNLTILCFFTSFSIKVTGQNMLGYIDPQGDFYVNDGGKIIHLEHLRISSAQPAANSVAYISGTGNLTYYSNHEIKKLDISFPTFYKNTNLYLYYSTGGSFSLYDGKERKYLGYIQNDPFAFGDSIAAFHDYAEYFYAFQGSRFIELEQRAAKKVIAGDNIIAYVNHIDQFKIFYDGLKHDIDDYIPVNIQAGANTVAYIDNYNYLKVFYKGEIFELFNLPEINCLEIPGGVNDDMLPEYCNAEIVYDFETAIPVFSTGDDIVAYIDDQGRFQVFYDGKIIVLEQQPPEHYEVIDNILWYIDNNNYFKVFNKGELSVVETFYPERIKADKDVVAYLDLDKRLKAFYNEE
ncbi:MAG: hypothetical protein ACHQFW_10715, partial [Chitinophagales bacterium]